jgi:hypothetical protein
MKTIHVCGKTQQAVKSAIVAKNKVGEGEAKYQLGKLHSRLHHPDIALSYQTDYLNFCCSVNDQVIFVSPFYQYTKARARDLSQHMSLPNNQNTTNCMYHGGFCCVELVVRFKENKLLGSSIPYMA